MYLLFFFIICVSGAHKVWTENEIFNHVSWDKQKSVCMFSYKNVHEIRLDVAPQSWIQNYQMLQNVALYPAQIEGSNDFGCVPKRIFCTAQGFMLLGV